MAGELDWNTDGADWPNREASAFVTAAGLDWHVQQCGRGPSLLLVHGTGASTHSWRSLMPALADRFRVTAPDLPGHGFTSMPRDHRLSLPMMADATGTLLDVLGVRPVLAVGHSAGAAILLRMCLDGRIDPRAVVAINGAILPFQGIAGQMFSPLARLFAMNPFVPHIFAWRGADPRAVSRLIRGTGSQIDAEGLELYRRLFSNPTHVGAALNMMANWNLADLEADLPRLETPLVLLAGGADAAIPAEDALRVRQLVPHAEVRFLRGLGHLAHEERPDEVAGIVERALPDLGREAPQASEAAQAC